MIDKHYPAYEKHIISDKTNHEQRRQTGKGILAVVFTFIIFLFVFGFLASFFEESSKRNTPIHNPIGSSQTTTIPEKYLNTNPLSYTSQDKISLPSYEKNPLGEGTELTIDSKEKPLSIFEKDKFDTILMPEIKQ
ncbi:hypothetical protein V3565_05985 [Bartonella sp. B10]